MDRCSKSRRSKTLARVSSPSNAEQLSAQADELLYGGAAGVVKCEWLLRLAIGVP